MNAKSPREVGLVWLGEYVKFVTNKHVAVTARFAARLSLDVTRGIVPVTTLALILVAASLRKPMCVYFVTHSFPPMNVLSNTPAIDQVAYFIVWLTISDTHVSLLAGLLGGISADLGHTVIG
jgi:hypothetical protein